MSAGLSYKAWQKLQQESAVVEKRGMEIVARVPVSRLRRSLSLLKLRGQSEYNTLLQARSAKKRGDIADARRFVLAAFGRSTPHTIRLLPEFWRDIVAIARGG